MKPYYPKYSITNELSDLMIKAAIAKALEIDTPMVIAILDESAELKIFYRMDKAPIISVNLAQNKAYTAVTHPWGMTTKEIFKHIQENPATLCSIPNIPNYVMFDGGYPIKIDGHIIGALGISGGKVDQDAVVAKAALSILEQL